MRPGRSGPLSGNWTSSPSMDRSKRSKGRRAGRPGTDQPVTAYYPAVALHRVLDLTDDVTVEALRVDRKDLFTNWRTSKKPTLTQLLGQGVNETGLFSAIRYPSKAAAAHGQVGINFVIFRDCVRAPDSIRILGRTSKPLQKWSCGESHRKG